MRSARLPSVTIAVIDVTCAQRPKQELSRSLLSASLERLPSASPCGHWGTSSHASRRSERELASPHGEILAHHMRSATIVAILWFTAARVLQVRLKTSNGEAAFSVCSERKKRNIVTLGFWHRTSPRVAMLVPLLLVITVIQVLPQVDLPDTAFHEDTAPVVTKSRPAPGSTLALTVQGTFSVLGQTKPVILRDASTSSTHPHNRSPLILFSTLLC